MDVLYGCPAIVIGVHSISSKISFFKLFFEYNHDVYYCFDLFNVENIEYYSAKGN